MSSRPRRPPTRTARRSGATSSCSPPSPRRNRAGRMPPRESVGRWAKTGRPAQSSARSPAAATPTVTQFQQFAVHLLAAQASLALWIKGENDGSLAAVQARQAELRVFCTTSVVARQGPPERPGRRPARRDSMPRTSRVTARRASLPWVTPTRWPRRDREAGPEGFAGAGVFGAAAAGAAKRRRGIGDSRMARLSARCHTPGAVSRPRDRQTNPIEEAMLGLGRVQALYVAVKLGIPDLLADAPCSSTLLASTTGVHPGALHRLLRFLAAEGSVGRSRRTAGSR